MPETVKINTRSIGICSLSNKIAQINNNIFFKKKDCSEKDPSQVSRETTSTNRLVKILLTQLSLTIIYLQYNYLNQMVHASASQKILKYDIRNQT